MGMECGKLSCLALPFPVYFAYLCLQSLLSCLVGPGVFSFFPSFFITF